jgi:peptidoglycan DL-endopeptidase CwlO
MPFTRTTRPLRAVAATLLALFALAGSGAIQASHAAPSRAELEAAKDRLYELERDFQLVVEEYNAINERLEDIQTDISGIEFTVKGIESRMSGKLDDAILLARELYKNGTAGSMAAVLSADSLAEMDARLAYMESSEEANSAVFEQLAADRSLLEDKLGELAEAEEKASAARARLAELREDIDAKVVEQQDEIGELTAAIERAEEREAAAAAAAREEAREEAAAAPPPPSDSGGDGGGSVAPDPAPGPNAGAGVAVQAALSQVGKPYQWGAEGPDSYDCSGLTLWAWAHAGVSLPHNSGMQYAATPRVSLGAIQPGDLLFYGSPIHHVSMYIGNNQMVEAPYTGSHVRVVPLRTSDFVGAGRP